MTNRPNVTAWWNAGEGVWQRYYGQYTLTVRKRGVGLYLVTVVDGGRLEPRSEVVFEWPARTRGQAKSAGERWVSNR